MSDIKITQLAALSGALVDRTVDVLEIADVSVGQSKKITPNALFGITGGSLVSTTDTQTLTNKTLTTPTISSPVLSGTLSGTYTLGGTPTFPATVVTTTGTQTLTNKTLTSPSINTPTITNATISANALTGFTTANTGTVYGIPITLGVINSANAVNGASLVAGSVSSTALAQNAVQANQLATNAITLGYAQMTSAFTTTSTTPVQVTSLTISVTVPAGGRRVKISVFSRAVSNNTNGSYVQTGIWDGAVVSGTRIGGSSSQMTSANADTPGVCFAVQSPSAGAKTYNVSLNTAISGTASMSAIATEPAFVIAELI